MLHMPVDRLDIHVLLEHQTPASTKGKYSVRVTFDIASSSYARLSDRDVNEEATSLISYGNRQEAKIDNMDSTRKCAFLLLLGLAASTAWANEDTNIFDKGYRTVYRIYEECQLRNGGVSPCLKKKAINFFDRLGRIENLSIADNLELVRVTGDAYSSDDGNGRSLERDIKVAMARNSGASGDDVLNDLLLDRVANLMNAFNVQIKMPKTTSGELKRSIEEGRGKTKKMMGMMMMGVAMKMAALVPLAMGVLFLLAGKALIISKIALVLSLIIGLKKLLSQKQSHETHHGGWQQSGGGGGWDRSLKATPGIPLQYEKQDSSHEHAQHLAYGTYRASEK